MSGTDSGAERNGGNKPVIDRYRAFIFPNRMREFRQRAGHARLLHFAAELRDIPYIRLSKIERGEVFARPEELRRIAAALRIAPSELLIDIDHPAFDIERWAEPFAGNQDDLDEVRFAMLLAAALRVRRARDRDLTIAAIERDFGIAPVNLSRLENALKPFGRWNGATRAAVLGIMGVANEAQLRQEVTRQHQAGELDQFIGAIATPESRHVRSRQRIAEIADLLAASPGAPGAPPSADATATATATTAPAPATRVSAVAVATRLVPVHGAPQPDGLVSCAPTGTMIEAPRIAGRRAFGLRMCRATLGGGLPAQATLIVDPDRYPAPGGLAALREQDGWRVLSVGADRDGRMIGYSTNPPLEIVLDACAPDTLAAIVSAIFV